MKIEIEAKMPLRDREATVRRLTDLHAEPVARMMEENIFVDCKEHRLHTSDRGLRVRGIREPDQSPRYTVTYKGPRRHGRLKNRREVEFQVDSPEAALELLAELGYHETVRFEKRRQRWRLDGCNIELDEVPYLGSFIEIEGPDEPTVFGVREQLGLADEPLITASYVAMLVTYLREHDIPDRRVSFADAEGEAGDKEAGNDDGGGEGESDATLDDSVGSMA